VKAYDFWNLVNQPLACSQFNATLQYMIPNGSAPLPVPMTCQEVSNALMYDVPITSVYESVIIENMQYFKLDINYIGSPLISPHSKLYLLYKGNNILFDGENVTPIDFTSLELPFGSFYKTQLSPFVVRNVSNLWQIGMPQLNYDEYQLFLFPNGYPYYEDAYGSSLLNSVRLFIKYNNDNNPFYVATITPVTVFGGLTKIGGYITIFGLLKVGLYLYNRHSFENSLLKKYRRRIKQTLDGDQKVDKQMIRDMMSYEMLMKLVINHLR
jgi:hypothetical protein